MKTFKTLDEAISTFQQDADNTKELNQGVSDLKSNGITKYKDTIYVVDELGILD